MREDEHLDWMPDGRELWDGVAHLQPTILTGLPMGNWAEPQKVSRIRLYLAPRHIFTSQCHVMTVVFFSLSRVAHNNSWLKA